MPTLRRVALVGAIALGVVAAGCSSSAPSTPSTTTAAPATTTTTIAPTTTEPSEAPERAATSAEAAARLVDAWKAKDRHAATMIADPLGVKGMFATPYEDIWLRSCTTDDSLPEGGCIYRTTSGLVQVNTEERDGGWVVSSVTYDALEDGNEVSGPSPEGPPVT